MRCCALPRRSNSTHTHDFIAKLFGTRSYRCLWTKHSSGEEDPWGKLARTNIQSGAGLQFLPLDCRTQARRKGMFLFHRHRYHEQKAAREALTTDAHETAWETNKQKTCKNREMRNRQMRNQQMRNQQMRNQHRESHSRCSTRSERSSERKASGAPILIACALFWCAARELGTELGSADRQLDPTKPQLWAAIFMLQTRHFHVAVSGRCTVVVKRRVMFCSEVILSLRTLQSLTVIGSRRTSTTCPWRTPARLLGEMWGIY